MTGLIVLGIFTVYIAAGLGIAAFAKGWWRVFVVAVFVLIPTWDIIPGKIALAHLCEREGGIKINRTVKDVDGFLSSDGRVYEEYFKRYGYKFVEIAKEIRDPSTGGIIGTGYIRVTLSDEGKLRKVEVGRPLSKYEFRDYRNYDTHISPWGITLFSASIVDIQTKEAIAVDKRFGWYGGWLRKINRPILGGGRGCDGANIPYADILVRTLIPVRGLSQGNQHG